jgi:hypothetical protein
MGIKTIFTESELCPNFGTQNLEIQTWYLPQNETFRIGVTVYTDYALTIKLGSNKSKGAIFQGKNYHFTTDIVGAIATINECQISVSAEIFTSTPSTVTGDVTLGQDGSVWSTRSKLAVTETASTYMVTDVQWDSVNFEDINLFKKVCFLGTETPQNVRTKILKNIDFESMRGFDFTAWVGYMKNNPIWEGGTFINQHFHIPAKTGQNRRSWNEGDVQYYFMPEEYVFDDSNIPKFLSFNDFSLPAGIVFFTQFKIKNVSQKTYLTKGCTHTSDLTAPLSQVATYDYDHWAYDLGCPEGNSPAALVEAWLTNVNESALVSSFQNKFVNTFKNYAYAIMDYEAIGSANVYTAGKLQACFNAWVNSNPTAKLGAWAIKILGYSRVDIEGNNYPQQLTDDLNYTGTYQQFRSARVPTPSPLKINADLYFQYFDVFYIGNYHNFPTNYGFLEHGYMELLMVKKFAPTKQVLFTYWHNIEYVSTDFPLSTIFFKKTDGTALKQGIKPVTFPHDMWNLGIWFFTEKNCGVDLWSEPYPRGASTDFYGDGKNTTRPFGEVMPDSYEQTTASIYASQNLKCVDWLFASAKRVSEHKDILESATEWQWTDFSSDGGVTWITGDNRLPSKGMYNKTAMCRIRYNTAGTEALVKIANCHQDATKQTNYIVKIGTKQYTIKLFGRYSSFVRIKNI